MCIIKDDQQKRMEREEIGVYRISNESTLYIRNSMEESSLQRDGSELSAGQGASVPRLSPLPYLSPRLTLLVST